MRSASQDERPSVERLTIDELAAETGMTSRNIRAHQTRGLLPPPVVVGRTGYYDRRHVDRLRLIQEMQAEGLNLNAIGWLLGGAAGVDDRDVRLLKRALLEPVAAEEPAEVDPRTVLDVFGDLDEAVVRRAIELGVVDIGGDGPVRVLAPTLFRRAQELAAIGVPLGDQLDVLAEVTDHARAVARAFIALFLRDVLEPFERAGRPPEAWAEMRDRVLQLRPLGADVLQAVFHRVMAEEIERALATAGE